MVYWVPVNATLPFWIACKLFVRNVCERSSRLGKTNTPSRQRALFLTSRDVCGVCGVVRASRRRDWSCLEICLVGWAETHSSYQTFSYLRRATRCTFQHTPLLIFWIISVSLANCCFARCTARVFDLWMESFCTARPSSVASQQAKYYC